MFWKTFIRLLTTMSLGALVIYASMINRRTNRSRHVVGLARKFREPMSPILNLQSLIILQRFILIQRLKHVMRRGKIACNTVKRFPLPHEAYGPLNAIFHCN